MKKLKLLLTVATTALAVGTVTGCGTSDNTVRVGLHLNLGAGAGYSAYNQGFAEAQGVNMEISTGTGPNLAASLIAGELDVSFMGNGVAYNYLTENSNIKLFALDNLTDDDRLIARIGDGYAGNDLTIESSLTDIRDALKGSTVALDQTGTPITFLYNLVTVINSVSTSADDYIWYRDTEGARIPTTLESYVDANEITLQNVTNANIAAGAESATWDFAIAYAPVSTTLENQTSLFKTVCKTSTHLEEYWAYTPSTWAVNTDWLANNEETFKKFVVALVQGMNFRHDYPETTCQDIETVTAGAVTAADLDVNIAEWLNADRQKEIINNGFAMELVENIVSSQGDDESYVKTAEQIADFSYLLEAIETLEA